MAESGVAQRNPSPYFCHVCNVRISPTLPEYTCPLCSSGFVEEMEPEASPSTTGVSRNVSFMDGAESEPSEQFYMPRLFQGMGGMGLLPRSHRAGPQISFHMRHSDGSSSTENGPMSTPMDLFIQQLFSNLGVTAVMERDGVGGVSFNRIFPQSLGDYAWGPNGLDNIITQLLSQLEGTGPPPADNDKVESLPVITISHKDVEENQECAVCKESYELNENVLRLPCKHLFHPECVKPWLELHDSCPVCRCSLNGRSTSEYT